MALQFPNQNQVVQTNDEDWKSQGFINIYYPTSTGKMKLGTLYLKDKDPRHAKIISYLAEDPSRIGAFMANAIIDFKAAEASGGDDIELPGVTQAE